MKNNTPKHQEDKAELKAALYVLFVVIVIALVVYLFAITSIVRNN